MLRLGLTGNLGSGKSTVAALFAEHGAHVLSSDEIARDLMQPGQTVFQQIAHRFGPGVLNPGGALDRPALARIAFAEGRADELNAIVHPAVIARQAELAAALRLREPGAILVVESALIFQRGVDGRVAGVRFDRTILVTAPEAAKITRFVRRLHPQGEPTPEECAALEAEARRRLALQVPDEQAAPLADYLLNNNGSLDHLRTTVDHLWTSLMEAAAIIQPA